MTVSDRDILLAAALEIVAESGADQLTLDRVLAAAGLTRARFYFFFDDIEDCVAALLSRAISILQGEVERRMQAGAGFSDGLMDTLLAAAWEPTAARRAIVRILEHDRNYEYARQYLAETWNRQAIEVDGLSEEQAALLCVGAIGALHAEAYGIAIGPHLAPQARRMFGGAATGQARPWAAATRDLALDA